MQIEMTFTFVGECPDDVRVGQQLRCETVVTVHTIRADMVDVSSYDEQGRKTFLPSYVELGLYANRVTLEPVTDA